MLQEVLAQEYDGALATNVGTPLLDSEALPEGICEAVAGCTRLAQAGIPSFPNGKQAAYAPARLREYVQRAERLGREQATAGPPPASAPPRTLPISSPILEPEAVGFLEREGFHFPEHAFVTDAELGLPVVMKVGSSETLHRSDVCGVLLDIGSLEQARQAFTGMSRRLAATAMRGVMLYRQLSGGVELIAGLKRDPDFGPVVIAGSGGVPAELVDDAAMRIAPFWPRPGPGHALRAEGLPAAPGTPGPWQTCSRPSPAWASTPCSSSNRAR